MSDEEVENLVKEAETNRESDKKKKESIEIRNQADSLVYQSEKTLEDNKGKYDEKDAETARPAIDRLKQLLADTNATKDDIEGAMKPVNDVMMKIGQAIYSHAGDPATDDTKESDTGSDKKDDDSVEAEVEEK